MTRSEAHNRFPPPSRTLLNEILEWDVLNWAGALAFWDQHLSDPTSKRVLEIGARGGGLSLHFALRGYRVFCSDLKGPAAEARGLHQRHGVATRVEYGDVDATAIPFAEGSFDIVCFKSVLGGIGRGDQLVRQAEAVREMHRVLVSGGHLLFAENMRASALHRWLRKNFVDWGEDWRYPTPEELTELLAIFSVQHLSLRGFLGAFGRRERQRTLLHYPDRAIGSLVPASWRYLGFGVGRK